MYFVADHLLMNSTQKYRMYDPQWRYHHRRNHVLQAEAITGSSRMKGGSATKIILETAFLSAINGLESNNPRAISPEAVTSALHSYQDICRRVAGVGQFCKEMDKNRNSSSFPSEFYSTNEISEVATKLIQRGGNALKNGAPIHYIASGWMGVIPLIDSTECPPTFGSSMWAKVSFCR